MELIGSAAVGGFKGFDNNNGASQSTEQHVWIYRAKQLVSVYIISIAEESRLRNLMLDRSSGPDIVSGEKRAENVCFLSATGQSNPDRPKTPT